MTILFGKFWRNLKEKLLQRNTDQFQDNDITLQTMETALQNPSSKISDDNSTSFDKEKKNINRT